MENFCKRTTVDKSKIEKGKKFIDTHADSISKWVDFYYLAGNSVRLKILLLLLEYKDLCVCDLADILQMTVPAVSQHLRKLKDKNMLFSIKRKQTVYYSLTDKCKEYMHFYKPVMSKLKHAL